MFISKRVETSHAQDFANPLELSTIGGWVHILGTPKYCQPSARCCKTATIGGLELVFPCSPDMRDVFRNRHDRYFQYSKIIATAGTKVVSETRNNFGTWGCYDFKVLSALKKPWFSQETNAVAIGRKVVFNVLQFVKDHPPSARPRWGRKMVELDGAFRRLSIVMGDPQNV